jgi:hypothetical protein
VKRKAPEEGHITLGFRISGDGKWNAQKKATKEKAILYMVKPYGAVLCGEDKVAGRTMPFICQVWGMVLLPRHCR